MIQHLIQAIVGLLHENLAGVRILAAPVAAHPAPPPSIAVYPGPFTMNQIGRQPSGQGTLRREFQQELRVDVYGANLAAAEQWASLACGIILSCGEDLLRAYNNPQHPATYRAGLFATTHVLNQLQLLAGSPIPTDDAWCYQLTFQTAGQIQIGRQTSEGDHVIAEVIIQ
jgi:hypothetical protein